MVDYINTDLLIKYLRLMVVYFINKMY